MNKLYFAERICSTCQRYPCNYTRQCIEVNVKDGVLKFWLYLERRKVGEVIVKDEPKEREDE